jgi:hypothetical protein
MRNRLPGLLEAFGAFLTGCVCVGFAISVISSQYLNYREQHITDWFYSWGTTALALCFLGAYSLALLVRSSSRYDTAIEPLFSVWGCVLGFLIGCVPIYLYFVIPALQQVPFLWFWILFLPILVLIFGFLIASRIHSRRNSNLILSISRILVPCAIALALILVNHSGFPGATAPVKLRQQWALKEFGNYNGVVKSIQNCRPIVERVGTIQAVAPTHGKNFVISDPGSSGHSGELTLEVVGKKGTGIANFKFHIGTSVSYVDFTYRNQTETLKCWE